MIRPLLGSLREWRSVTDFTALPAADRNIVFYAEDAVSWSHFESIVDELTGPLGRTICYLTSSVDDPILDEDRPNVRAFSVGRGRPRTSLFYNLKADVVVMTMPDLETFQIKRSRVSRAHYVYVFHSMVSTHMIYRAGAFDHFDTMLCVGPHHVREVRSTEREYGLEPKRLVEHGYGRLDAILRSAATPRPAGAGAGPRTILVAPSWGPHGLIETAGVPLVGALLAAGYRVVVRPHPMTGEKWPGAIAALRDRFLHDPRFTLETDIAPFASLRAADLMISDWSGAALEFAFGLERPVLFVDLPRKVNNPEYERIPAVPLEVSIRSQIGHVVAPGRPEELPEQVEDLCDAPERFAERIRAERSKWVFNVGSSGAAGARYIAGLADECRSARGHAR